MRQCALCFPESEDLDLLRRQELRRSNQVFVPRRRHVPR